MKDLQSFSFYNLLITIILDNVVERGIFTPKHQEIDSDDMVILQESYV